MEVTYKVALEVATHEGMVRQAYKDSVGVWTWSVGLTNATGHTVERYIGKPQTLEHCLRIYVWALENYADAVRRAFAGHDLTEAQFAAALSFHWNTGAIKRATWVERWKTGDIEGAKSAFMDWNQPTEIIPRRRAERDLFFDGKWAQNGTMTEYTRVSRSHSPVWRSARKVDVSDALRSAMAPPINTPTAIAEDAAAEDRTSTSEVGAVLVGVGGGAQAVKETVEGVQDAVQGARDLSDVLLSVGPWVIVGLLVSAGAVYLWRERRRKKRQAREALVLMEIDSV